MGIGHTPDLVGFRSVDVSKDGEEGGTDGMNPQRFTRGAVPAIRVARWRTRDAMAAVRGDGDRRLRLTDPSSWCAIGVMLYLASILVLY